MAPPVDAANHVAWLSGPAGAAGDRAVPSEGVAALAPSIVAIHTRVPLPPHDHVLVLDGVVSAGPDGSDRFHEAVGLTPERWEELQGVMQRRVLRYFRRHELLDAHVTHDMAGGRAAGSPSMLPYAWRGTPTPDGRSVLVLTPLELLDRLARLIPPPPPGRGRMPWLRRSSAKRSDGIHLS